MPAGAPHGEHGGTGPFRELFPVDQLQISLGVVSLWYQSEKGLVEHLVLAATEQFFRRWIHQSNRSGAIDDDHSVENLFDDAANPNLGRAQLRQVSADQGQAVGVR